MSSEARNLVIESLLVTDPGRGASATTLHPLPTRSVTTPPNGFLGPLERAHTRARLFHDGCCRSLPVHSSITELYRSPIAAPQPVFAAFVTVAFARLCAHRQ